MVNNHLLFRKTWPVFLQYWARIDGSSKPHFNICKDDPTKLLHFPQQQHILRFDLHTDAALVASCCHDPKLLSSCQSVRLEKDALDDQANKWNFIARKETVDWLSEPNIKGKFSFYASLLQQYGNSKALADGKCVHAHVIICQYDRDRYIGNLLIQMYGKCGAISDANAVFAQMPQRNEYSWAIMIGVYISHGQGAKAFTSFRQMNLEGLVPDEVTVVSVLSACASPATLAQGKSLHLFILDSGYNSNVFVGTALVHMYSKCGTLQDAVRIFNHMSVRNTVTWNAMITAYAQHGKIKEVFELFHRMDYEGIIANRVTFISILDACACEGVQAEGRLMHLFIVVSGLESNVSLGNALICMYGNCDSLQDANDIFSKIPQHDVVSWTGMLAAYANHGQGERVLQLFRQMHEKGVLPNKITFITTLEACTNQAILHEGRLMHARITSSGFELDAVVGSALVSMYGNCGNMQDALRMFLKISEQDVVSWTAMIVVFAQHGQGVEALQAFHQMILEGITPDTVTFFGVLSACDHAGLVDDACCCFVSMSKDYAMTPTLDHHSCIVDLFGRAGRLDQVEALINVMPTGHSTALWMNVLSACRMHLDVDRGISAAEHLFELDPENAAPYVLLSNMYAAAGRPDNAAKMWKAMKEEAFKKSPRVND